MCSHCSSKPFEEDSQSEQKDAENIHEDQHQTARETDVTVSDQSQVTVTSHFSRRTFLTVTDQSQVRLTSRAERDIRIIRFIHLHFPNSTFIVSKQPKFWNTLKLYNDFTLLQMNDSYSQNQTKINMQHKDRNQTVVIWNPASKVMCILKNLFVMCQ